MLKYFIPALAFLIPSLRADSLIVTLIDTIKVGAWPKAVEVAPCGKFAYVTNFSGGSISIIDCESLKVTKTIRIKGAPVEVDYSINSKYAYVTDFQNERLLIYETDSHALKKAIKLGVNPKIIKVSPDGNLAFVSNWSSWTISVIDLRRDSVINKIRVGVNPRGIAILPDQQKLYVANFDTKSNSVSVIVLDTTLAKITGKVIKTIKNITHNPRHIVASPDTKNVYVSAFNSGRIYVIATKNDSVIKNIKIGGKPKTLVLSRDGRYLFIANFGADRLDIMDTETDSIISVKAGKNPCGLDLAPDEKRIYLTNWNSNNVMVFSLVRLADRKKIGNRSNH